MKLISLILTLISLNYIISTYVDKLKGDQLITWHDYEGMDANSRKNPPSCGYDYDKLDLTRVTAVESLDKSHCGACLKVANPTSKNEVYVLVIDMGGRGLDLSESSYTSLFNTTDHPLRASWQPVDNSFCNGILKY
ncbi:hypothetical protein CONCODRAFT_13216 [Conidiobolus coronatus NRRL 28638]|uniref:Barwin-like endoglucanase n=1 Tax=Conidiobolus coronatus (strain ATCC 28846 / CBS 209.66 / NRRL 28638) TaxID=796925 RepID=A0A137NR64_CONC2|nr:hypothetical protein CONCODRAFT_13216 [Conidiobolus coronatus NRRL 28638]|eukprot:KXN65263.1 hypothetical protein CONCODRAFT_13216 [Conidiobolus coronatus NRRL 28638]